MHPVTPSPSSPRPGATAHPSVSHQQRHDRYTAALALLGSPEAIIRLGGALALVELADDWLTDETDPQEHGRRKAQTIITTLCAYICSPFQLAHDYERLMGDQPQGLPPQQARRFRAEKTELAAEAQVRGRILTEIHDRVRWEPSDGGQPATNTAPDPEKVTAGLWSHLRFDFSGAVFSTPWISPSRIGVRARIFGGARTATRCVLPAPFMGPMPCLTVLCTTVRRF